MFQIWPSLLSGLGARSPKLPSSIFSLKSPLLKIYAPDQDPLELQSIHRNLYSVLTRASSIMEKEALVDVVVTAWVLWLLHGDMLPSRAQRAWGGGGILSTSPPPFSTYQGS